MRAATAIVGAIAVSSVLIALAFVLSAGDDSGQAETTRTVTERVEAAKPKAEGSTPSEAALAQVGGPTPCGGGEFTVEGVSCEVGAEIHTHYSEGGRGELIAEDQEAGETITMSCEETAPVTCSGPGGARVYFAP